MQTLADNRSFMRAHYLMGAIVQIEASSPDFAQTTQAVDASFAEMKRVEKKLSKFLSESEVSLLNREAAHRPVEVSEELFDILLKVQEYYQLTLGLFDPTLGALTKLWEEAERAGQLPSQAMITQLQKNVGFEKVVLNQAARSVFFTTSEIQLDLGGVGKGYAVDCAVRVLKSFGIDRAMIHVGSTIYSLGFESQSFAIQTPGSKDHYFDSVELLNEALSTSGQEERFFEIKGKKYGHLLHPKTGKPHQGKVKSSTAIHASAMISDMLSSAFLLMSPGEIKDFVARNEGVRAVELVSNWWGKSLARFPSSSKMRVSKNGVSK